MKGRRQAHHTSEAQGVVGSVSLGVYRTHRPDHGLGTIGEDRHVCGISGSKGALEGQHCEVVDERSVQETNVVAATLKTRRGAFQS